MTDRLTPAERAADLTHDPRRCHICLDPNRYGEQAPDPEELAHAREVDAFREQVATLTAERDGAVAEAAALRRERDVALADLVRRRDESVLIDHANRLINGERELCAQVAEADRCPVHSPYSLAAAERIAAAIRARSKP